LLLDFNQLTRRTKLTKSHDYFEARPPKYVGRLVQNTKISYSSNTTTDKIIDQTLKRAGHMIFNLNYGFLAIYLWLSRRIQNDSSQREKHQNKNKISIIK